MAVHLDCPVDRALSAVGRDDGELACGDDTVPPGWSFLEAALLPATGPANTLWKLVDHPVKVFPVVFDQLELVNDEGQGVAERGTQLLAYLCGVEGLNVNADFRVCPHAGG